MIDDTPDGAGTHRYDDLRALFINCTLKRSPERSHTQGLISRSQSIMDKQGVTTEVIRAIDHDIATGVWPDMTEHGWPADDWPRIYQQVLAADILVIAGPIWLGDNSSVTKSRPGGALAPAASGGEAHATRVSRPRGNQYSPLHLLTRELLG
jgi:hypothetical protein